jgi:dipeptidyl aminopeptidase/acylaminoacyl peptidase
MTSFLFRWRFSGWLLAASISLLQPQTIVAQSAAKKLLTVDDIDRLREVSSPQVSADGNWVAYTVSTVDRDADKRITNLWMTSWDGAQQIQLTHDTESASSPRWSPDGKYLSFVSSRPGKAKGPQVWVLDRRGGEASQLTHFKDFNLSAYEWSPDGQTLLLTLKPKEDAESEEPKPGAPPKPPKPVVIDRYHFKQDQEGYLSGTKRNHLYLFDMKTEKLEQLTAGDHDDAEATWSPDGKEIAFISSLDKDPDRTLNTDVFVINAHVGAAARKLTDNPGPDSGPLTWSPDSRSVAYLQGSPGKYSAYNMDRLAIVPIAGEAARVLTAKLDRGVGNPLFSKEGNAVTVLVADDRSEYPAKVSVTDGSVERLVGGKLVVSSASTQSGHTAVLASTDTTPAEVFALEGGSLRKLSAQNDQTVAELQLGVVEDISFKSHDGTEVHGLVTKPPAYESGRKYPTLLRIHGGPNGQDAHAFNFERQLFAAHGYIVVNVNYRGSSGRGEKYGEIIFDDWGNKEVADLLAAVDSVVNSGLADPQRLGIGGWSYGGILTNYTIATDGRFKAAISGAGSANLFLMYGVDQYTYQYDNELGFPWRNTQNWIKLSYPFLKADHIHTPTLFMGGDKDFNVPLVGSEQMYQALQTLQVPTELVIYPGEFHGFKRPSFIRDRYERYLAWYGKYLQGSAGTMGSMPTATK